MRVIVLLFAIIVLSSCTDDVKSVKSNWFDIPGLGIQLANNMSSRTPSVNKTFILNDVVESVNIDISDSGFWKQELSKLAEIDLNSPQVRGYIKLNSKIEDDNSNLLIDQYTLAEGSNSPIEKISLYYLDDPAELRQISISLNKSNLVTQSSTELNIWLNRYQKSLLIDSLKLKHHEKIIMQSPRDYENRIKVLW
ncbi:MAG: hypothetical protein ABFS32_06525 [Bacteroidota bacterium]